MHLGRVHRSQLGAAWLAAVIDCEGSICVTAGKRARAGFNIYAQVFVSVSNTCHALLEEVQRVADCGCISGPQKPKRGQIHYQWRAKGVRNTEAVLLRIAPFLIVKKERAADLLRALRSYRRLMRAPLLDAERCARYQCVPQARVRRLRLANRGTLDVMHVLLPWLNKHQPGTQALTICEEAVKKTALRRRDTP